MIESLKVPELNSKKLDTLKYINPWWEKHLKKLVVRQAKWLEKFKTNPDDFFFKDNFSIEEYDQLFEDINKYLKFYQQKMKLIITNKKIFRRFQKMIFDCVEILALTHGIDLLMNYYLDLEHGEILNKKEHVVRLANQLTTRIYGEYKKGIQKLFPQESIETLNQIYLNEKYVEAKLFKPDLIFGLIVKYANKMVAIKKLETETGLNILYWNLVSANFINHYNFFVENLLQKIP